MKRCTTTGDAAAGDIMLNKKAWVDGVEVTGSIVTQTLSAANDTVSAGYYNATTLSAVDADLATGNIKSGTTIFGVAGKTEVVDTTTGDAAAGDIMLNKKAWVDGVEVTGTAYPAAVEKTGDSTDGDAGVAWPSPRFTNNLDGTVTDELTGLMWLQNPDATRRIWANADTYCTGLTTGGYTDWRLPNVKELQSLIDFGTFSPALPSGHPFTGVQSDVYWSSSTDASSTTNAWFVYLFNGYVDDVNKTLDYYVWPVR